MDEEELKTLLAPLARDIPAPSADFAGRIIMAAARTRQQRPVSLWGYISDSFAEFMLPKPAYVLASMMVLGLVFGWTLVQRPAEPAKQVDYVQDFVRGSGWGI